MRARALALVPVLTGALLASVVALTVSLVATQTKLEATHAKLEATHVKLEVTHAKLEALEATQGKLLDAVFASPTGSLPGRRALGDDDEQCYETSDIGVLALDTAYAMSSHQQNLTAQLKGKADTAVMNAELSKKVDKSTMNTELAKKVDKNTMDTELAKKADKNSTDTELARKVNKSTMDTELAKKVDTSTIDALSQKLQLSSVESGTCRRAVCADDPVNGIMCVRWGKEEAVDCLNTNSSTAQGFPAAKSNPPCCREEWPLNASTIQTSTKSPQVFSNDTLFVKIDGTVKFTWIGLENVEQVDGFKDMNAVSGGIRSGSPTNGGSFSYTFAKAGVYYFRSQINDDTLRATVNVMDCHYCTGTKCFD